MSSNNLKQLEPVEGEVTSNDIHSETVVDGSAGNIKFSSPSLTDDDDSILLPKSVKCDGCLSLAYQVVEAFDKIHAKKKSIKMLPEADVLEILETLCHSKFERMGRTCFQRPLRGMIQNGLLMKVVEAFDKIHAKKKSIKMLPEADVLEILETLCHSKFERMGLKNVDGVTKLSGPGLDTANDPGMIMSGGRWPQRMRYLCGNIVGEFGEEELYDYYLFNRDNMGDVLCRGDGVASSCSDLKTKQKSEKAKDEF